jgi:Ala-tRNA(Pro) deacylase
MPILTKLKEFLDGNQIAYTVLTHSPAYTAQEVAAAEHVPGKEFAKVVIAKAGDRFVMAVIEAPQRLDVGKLGKLLPEGTARLATEAEFKGLFPACEPGAMPPFGNLFGLPVFVDEDLQHDEEIVFQAGTHTQAVRMKYADFARIVRPTAASLALSAIRAGARG